MTLHIRDAADKIKADSGGQVELQLFPNNVLGGDTAMLSQVRSGAIQFLHFGDNILQTLVPVAAIDNVGFAFPGYKEVWPALDGALGSYVRDTIAKTSGLYAFEKIWDNGFRQMTTSTHLINTAADLQGSQAARPSQPDPNLHVQGARSAPTPINFAEVYTALQTRVVDGQENPLALIETAKLYEVQKILLANQSYLERLLVPGQ